MPISLGELRAIQRLGAKAARKQMPVSTNPYLFTNQERSDVWQNAYDDEIEIMLERELIFA